MKNLFKTASNGNLAKFVWQGKPSVTIKFIDNPEAEEQEREQEREQVKKSVKRETDIISKLKKVDDLASKHESSLEDGKPPYTYGNLGDNWIPFIAKNFDAYQEILNKEDSAESKEKIKDEIMKNMGKAVDRLESYVKKGDIIKNWKDTRSHNAIEYFKSKLDKYTTVRKTWENKTGLSWKKAKELGYTDGGKEGNLNLYDKMKSKDYIEEIKNSTK